MGRFTGIAPEVSASENRRLTERPPLPRTAKDWFTFPERFEKFHKDHFGFRQQLLRLHSRVMVNGLSTSPNSAVILGKEGWLFYNGVEKQDGDPIADARGSRPFTREELEAAASYILTCRERAESQGIAYFLVIAPNRETMVPEYLPDGYESVGLGSPLEQIVNVCGPELGESLVDLRPVLLEASKEARVLHKYDSHWNMWGAYAAHVALQQRVKARFPRATFVSRKMVSLQQKDVEVTSDLVRMVGLIGEYMETDVRAVLHIPKSYETKMIPRKPQPFRRVTSQTKNRPKALFFHDSFTLAMLPYLNHGYGEILYVWQRAIDWNRVEKEKPDLVVHILVERQLRYFPGHAERFARTVPLVEVDVGR
jgi:hypothetical protein